jgi:uncharacterized membrane protein YjjB (DUF3815 family)
MAVTFAYASYAPLRALLPAAMMGALGSLVFTLMTRASFGPAWSTAAAAFAVGLGGYSLGRRSGVPPLVLVVSGSIPLLPGLTIYKGLYELMGLGNLLGIFSLLTAIAIGVALASGVILGEYVAQPIRREARRLEDRRAWSDHAARYVVVPAAPAAGGGSSDLCLGQPLELPTGNIG